MLRVLECYMLCELYLKVHVNTHEWITISKVARGVGGRVGLDKEECERGQEERERKGEKRRRKPGASLTIHLY